jgi:hypothetical protein
LPAYKRQHFLPAGYLKYFSTDQSNCTRKSLVWRFDQKTIRQVPIESQCSRDFFYSKAKAAEAEQMFQINENAYCACIDRIREGQEPVGRNLGDLLLTMFDFYLRNAVHKNRTGREGLEAYSRRVDIFLGQILLCRPDDELEQADIKDHLEKYWRVEIISCPSDFQFLTSDHPSMWRTLGRITPQVTSKLHLIALPITPKHVALAYDNRVLEIKGNKATTADVGLLNFNQIQNAEKCAFMSRQFPPDQLQKFQDSFAKKPSSGCETTEVGWQIGWIPLPGQNYFSFIRLKPIVL